MTTVAPGTTPLGSVTVPTMVPVVTWAAMGAVQADASAADTTAAKRTRFIMAAPSPEPAEASLSADGCRSTIDRAGSLPSEDGESQMARARVTSPRGSGHFAHPDVPEFDRRPFRFEAPIARARL